LYCTVSKFPKLVEFKSMVYGGGGNCDRFSIQCDACNEESRVVGSDTSSLELTRKKTDSIMDFNVSCSDVLNVKTTSYTVNISGELVKLVRDVS